jgi:hypothetical protein
LIGSYLVTQLAERSVALLNEVAGVLRRNATAQNGSKAFGIAITRAVAINNHGSAFKYVVVDGLLG